MYIPEEGEYGLSVLLPALRDYLATDTQLMTMLGGSAEDCIIAEGFLDESSPDTVILLATIGDGLTEAGEGTSLIRILAYVISKGRGYYKIENILPRLKTLFESDGLWEALTFPPEVGFAVVGIRAPGTTASTTLPRYSSEMRGVYTFVTTIATTPDEAPSPPPPPPPPDTEAPTAPGAFAATPYSTSVLLSWAASTDNVGVQHYAIYEDGILLDTTTSLGYLVTGLTAETAYDFSVEAVDAAANVSSQSSVSTTTAAPSGGVYTFTPVAFAANVDAPNRLRGLSWWRGAPRYVPDVVTEIEYQRFTWDQLETASGGINLTPLHTFVNAAESRGRRTGFRIQTFVPGDPRRVPSDIPTTTVSGNVIPVWDNPIFLTRLNLLFAAIAASYNGDPRIAYIDIGVYGSWGEWHMYGFGGYVASSATQYGIIDAHLTHFDQCQLLMMTDSDFALGYSTLINHSPQVGLRRDSWGHLTQFDAFAARPNYNLYWTDRWMTAPFVVEAYAAGGFAIDTQAALDQVETYHLTSAGNANIPGNFVDLPQPDKDRWRLIQAALGFRFRLTEVVIDTDTQTFTVEWTNEGNAPVYEDISPEYYVKTTLGVDYSPEPDINSLQFPLIMPGDVVTDGPLPLTSGFTNPGGLPPGDYELFVSLMTTNGDIVAYALAQEGEQGNDSYLLGAFTIS